MSSANIVDEKAQVIIHDYNKHSMKESEINKGFIHG